MSSSVDCKDLWNGDTTGWRGKYSQPNNRPLIPAARVSSQIQPVIVPSSGREGSSTGADRTSGLAIRGWVLSAPGSSSSVSS